MIAGPAIEITDAMITNSNISTAGEPAAYDAGTSYALAAQVTYQNYVFESLQSSNIGNTPPDENVSEWWVRVRATNKFKPFEHDLRRIRLYDQCTNAESITFELAPNQRFDMIGFFNLDALSLQVVMTDPVAGEVYNETVDLDDRSNVVSFWDWYFPEFVTASEKVLFDLPPYKNATLEITISKPGGTAAVGQIALAKQVSFGDVVFGSSIGGRDFGTYDQDINGQYSNYVPRGKARVVNYRAAVTSEEAGRIARTFDNQLLGRAAIYSAGDGTERYGTTVFARGRDISLPLEASITFLTMTAEQFV